MKFLVINDNKNLSSKIEEKIIDNNIKNKCFCCNFSVEDIKQHLKEFKSLGFCIILNEKPDNIDKTILSFLHELKGYLFAENIIIITNIESLKSQSLTNSSNINYISSPDEIINFLDKKTDKILSAAKKRLAKKKLLDKGIPYTEDCFATYIAKNKPLIFDEFIEAGMDINSRDDLGTPILNVACRNDNFDFLTKILDLGADINASSTDRGYTAIMDAVWRGNEKIASYLIQHGAELNTINKEGQNNLILAVGANRYNRQYQVDGARWIDACMKKYLPNATCCVDGYHVVTWAMEGLDNVRKDIWHALNKDSRALQNANPRGRGRPTKEDEAVSKQIAKAKNDAKLVKGSSFTIGKAPENLTPKQEAQLEYLALTHKQLFRAYKLKEQLRLALKFTNIDDAKAELDSFFWRATHSRISYFKELAYKIRRHEKNILNTIKTGLSNARVES